MLEGPLSLHLLRCLDVCMYRCMNVGFSSTSKGKPSLANENAMADFCHYYALRIFHVYKCTVNENTNKSAYWYTSHKSSIPGFGKPGIVAEICPSGFVHSSYLPSDWLMLVWTHPLSQIGNNTFFPNHWVVPFTCCGSQCCLAPKCFLLKIKHFGWFP